MESTAAEDFEDLWGPALPRQQLERINRMNDEPLFLIQVGAAGEFKVSGSTGNLYTVTVHPDASQAKKLVTCNCPDASMHAKRWGVLCKHACFVLIKALRLPLSVLVGAVNKQQILGALESIRQRNWGHLSNEEYQERYTMLCCGSGGDETEASQHDTFTLPIGAKITDDCAICLDPMIPQDCSRCPGCIKDFHTVCISMWLKVGYNNRCPLCRHSWESFVEQEEHARQEQTKSRGFINLAQASSY